MSVTRKAQLTLEAYLAMPGPRKRRRERDNEIDGREDGKTPIKPGKKITLKNRATQRATGNNEQPSSSRKRNLASGSQGLSGSSRPNTIKGRSTIDLTSSDSPPRLGHTNRSPVPYLPTPVTTTKRPAKQPRAPVPHAHRSSPVTPTKVRSIPKGSGLLSPPPSSQLGYAPTENIITTSPIAPAASPSTRSGTVVPSSQTQVLEINPFLSPKRTSPRQHPIFKLPKLPQGSTIRTPAFNLHPTVNDDEDDDTCVIPSSQTQELVYHRPLTPPSRLHIHNEDPSAGEVIPDSQPPEHEVQVAHSPTRQRTQSHPTAAPVSGNEQGTDDDHSREHTQRDIVPTSQSAFEKEISSSDLLDIKSRFPVPAEPLGALNQTKALDTRNSALTSTPTRTRILSASNPRTPTSAHRHRVFGQDTNTNTQHSPSTRPSIAPLQKLTTTPRTPRSPQKTPHSVRFHTPDNSPSKLAALAIPGSSQTEPESSQWHVPTQHTQRSPSGYARARVFDDSSQTEPEESQWHVPTQHIPIPTQSSQSSVSSMTEPESSQYHVPTQYTPRGHHRLGAPRFDVDVDASDEEEEDELARGSLPIASYPDPAHDDWEGEDGAPLPPPPSSSTRQDSPPVRLLPTTTVDSQVFDSQIELSREALERLEHVRSRLGIVHTGRLLDSQFSVSGVSVSGSAFSIPSDYWSCEES